ncbi:hypothetical protein HanIR_Chr11g0552871 [Helianthus annuus]|nr:hypothetical protein HanIR_Chr11g0552871 [Helianthus annuus]
MVFPLLKASTNNHQIKHLEEELMCIKELDFQEKKLKYESDGQQTEVLETKSTRFLQ